MPPEKRCGRKHASFGYGSKTSAALEDTGTLVLNREAILKAIECIAVRAQDTVERLRALVKNYQVDRIRKLLEDIDG